MLKNLISAGRNICTRIASVATAMALGVASLFAADPVTLPTGAPDVGAYALAAFTAVMTIVGVVVGFIFAWRVFKRGLGWAKKAV